MRIISPRISSRLSPRHCSQIGFTGRGLIRALTLAAAFGLLASAAACSPENDPLVREGLWRPSHANRQNLTLQVANPGDLVRGSGTTGGDGQLAAAAIDRLRNDKVKKLPAADLAQVTSSNSGSNDSSGGGGQ